MSTYKLSNLTVTNLISTGTTSFTNVVTPSIDRGSAGTLTIGGTTATALAFARSGVASTFLDSVAATSVLTPILDRATSGTLTLGGTATKIAPSTNGQVTFGDSTHKWKDGYFGGTITTANLIVDGYNIDPAGAIIDDVLKYNGSAFVPSSGGGGTLNGLKSAYDSALLDSDNIITLGAFEGGEGPVNTPIIIKDNATPFGGRLFSITNNSDLSEYFSVYSIGSVIGQRTITGGNIPNPVLSIFTAPHNTLQAGSEFTEFQVVGDEITWNTGAKATQRFNLFNQHTISFAGASTVTTAATVAIEGPPQEGTLSTITNAYALWVQGGKSQFDDDVSITGTTTIPFVSGQTIISVNGIPSGSDTARTHGLLLWNQTTGSDQNSPGLKFQYSIDTEAPVDRFWSIQARDDGSDDGYLSFDSSTNGTTWAQQLRISTGHGQLGPATGAYARWTTTDFDIISPDGYSGFSNGNNGPIMYAHNGISGASYIFAKTDGTLETLGNIVPVTSDGYSIGSSSKKYKDGYFSGQVGANAFYSNSAAPTGALHAFNGSGAGAPSITLSTGSNSHGGVITVVTSSDAAGALVSDDWFTITMPVSAPHGWAITLMAVDNNMANKLNGFTNNTAHKITGTVSTWKLSAVNWTQLANSTTYTLSYVAFPY